MKLNNKDVAQAFVECCTANSDNMHSTGLKCFSCDTCIAQHYGENNMILNVTKYNKVTSRHLSLIKAFAEDNFDIIEVNDVPEGTNSLTDFIL